MDTYNYSSPPLDDGPLPDSRFVLTAIAGLVAAVVAGGLWALVVLVGRIELGLVAWGIGLLVGIAMTRVTEERSQKLAYTAAALAAVGLLAGKAFIFLGSTGAVAEDFADDPSLLNGALAWYMYDERTLDAPTLAEIDATRAAGDTLSDALWANMLQQSEAKLESMTPEERRQVASVAAANAMAHFGLVGGITAQFTAFDLLWALLALGTAFRMLSPPQPEEAAEPQAA